MKKAAKKPSRQEREWRRRRRDILKAAADLFVQFGYGGTTMQAIAAAAEYSVGYIYKHFPTKSDMLDAIIDDQMTAYETNRAEIRETFAGRPVEALVEQMNRMCRQIVEQADLVDIFLGYEAACPERIRPRIMRYRQEDADYFREARRTGRIGPCDPELTSAAYEGVCWGLIRLMLETDSLDRVPEIPGLAYEILLAPLIAGRPEENRKETRRT